MPGRNKRSHYSFELGAGIQKVETDELPRLAYNHVRLARFAMTERERPQVLARLDAAEEALLELRSRGEQLRL